jgi:hypothetical protein
MPPKEKVFVQFLKSMSPQMEATLVVMYNARSDDDGGGKCACRGS